MYSYFSIYYLTEGITIQLSVKGLISETNEAYLGKVMIVSDFMETVVRNGGVNWELWEVPLARI